MCVRHPGGILIVGLVAGALVTFSVELLDLRLEVDDPGGSISVHAVGGIWGVLAVGLFGRLEAGGAGQLLAQAVGDRDAGWFCPAVHLWAESALEPRDAAARSRGRRASGNGSL